MGACGIPWFHEQLYRELEHLLHIEYKHNCMESAVGDVILIKV